MPNPPAPIETKRRRGTLRGDRVPNAGSLAAVPAIPAASYEMSVSEALESVLSAGVVWLAATDAPKVSLLRETVEDYAEMRADPKTPAKDIRDVRDQIAKLLSELGFDPTSRSRLGLAEVKAASKLEELRARRMASPAVDADHTS